MLLLGAPLLGFLCSNGLLLLFAIRALTLRAEKPLHGFLVLRHLLALQGSELRSANLLSQALRANGHRQVLQKVGLGGSGPTLGKLQVLQGGLRRIWTDTREVETSAGVRARSN